ncbi:MAG: SCO1664 family protein [Actinomycetota bacterium]|nr:SCO1664 family protein [Actinomycetota bacterium]
MTSGEGAATRDDQEGRVPPDASSAEATNEVLDLLATGEIEVLGLLPYSSNYVFLARVGTIPHDVLAVYKPRRGERPLWDFASGTLATREVAAFVLSEVAGWRFVPPTVLREDGPLGEGSLQLFIDHDPERHYYVLAEERLNDFPPFVAFDVIVNNADRKAGHIVEDSEGRLWAVDHGLTFNSDPKLRTVIWELAGKALDDDLRGVIQSLVQSLRGESGTRLTELLSPVEVAATIARAERLLEEGVFPQPTGARPLPWPLI